MLLIVCYLSFYCIVAVAKGSVIYVEPTNIASCNESLVDNYYATANQSLQSLLANVTSNSVLKLLPGCHLLDRYVPILDKTNVTIEGVGESPDNVTISCDRNPVGMTFVNTSQLNVRMLTLQDCGLSGVDLNDTINRIKDNYLNSFESIFKLSLSTEIGLFIAISSDVTLDTIVVKGVHGFGLLAVNVINSFHIESSLFAYNYNETCFSSPEYGLGGGASIIFQDNDVDTQELKLDNNYILNIENTTFLNNSNCALDSRLDTYSSRIRFATAHNGVYSFAGGGGLTVYLANHNYSVSVNVTECTFRNNTGTSGGGMFVGTFVGTGENTVTIKDSLFYRNGFQFGTLSDIAHLTTGQGLYILKDINFPNNLVSLPVGINQFMLVNCIFRENAATTTAGVALFSRYRTLGNSFASDSFTFRNCIFVDNIANAATAMFLFEAKQNGHQPGINVTIADSKFKQNSLATVTNQFGLSSQSVTRLNIVQSMAVTITLVGKNEFSANTGTPISLQSSILEVNGELSFCRNIGNIGGGLALSSSYLVLKPDSYVLFENNQAYLKAGAILFNTIEPAISNYDCFLFFRSVSKVCNDFSDCINPNSSNITMTFINNTAAISNVAYGSTLTSCPWVPFINSTYNLTNATDPFRMLEEIGVFHFKPPLDEDSLSTDAASLTAEINSTWAIMPGEDIPVLVRVYDGFNQPIPNFISSVIINDSTVVISGSQQSKLGNSSYWFVGRDRFLEVPLSVQSAEEIANQENVTLTIGIYSTTSTIGQLLNVTVRKCSPGFDFLNGSADEMYYTCTCSKGITSLTDPSVSCFEGNATIIVPNGFWLGNDVTGRWTLTKCVFDYCDSGDYIIQHGQFDAQCRKEYNRKGILCGECQDGYSIQFGTNKCAKCNNLGILWFVVFLLMGVSIVFLIGRLGISVSYGYINSLMFFANVIGPFQTTLTTNLTFDYFFLPINLLNGGFGVEACVYNGMTSIQLTFIDFLFPVYLYVLLLLYTALGRYCNRTFKKWAANAPQVFATIILLTYTSLLKFCIGGLSFLKVQGTLRWSIDPNVEYSDPVHIVMVLLCIAVLIVVLIPAAVFLTFPSITFRTFVGKKFVPIYDAVWAPFKERRHFWVGFRLLLRVVPLMLAAYVPQPWNILLLGVFICIYIFIHYVFKPFKREIQNNLEIYLNSCVLLFVIGALHDDIDPVFEGVYFGVVIELAYIAFALVVFHHLYMKSSFLQRSVASVMSMYRNCLEAVKTIKLKNDKDTTVVNDFGESEEIDNLSFTEKFSIQKQNYSTSTNRISVRNNELRESLLDDPYL